MRHRDEPLSGTAAATVQPRAAAPIRDALLPSLLSDELRLKEAEKLVGRTA